VLQSYGYYEGARLANASETAEYRLNEVRSEVAALLDPDAAPEATAARLAEEFAPDTWFKVYDYGVGDEVVWPYAVSVTRVSDYVYDVQAPVPVTVSLPEAPQP
jgi:hypothetical protein